MPVLKANFTASRSPAQAARSNANLDQAPGSSITSCGKGSSFSEVSMLSWKNQKATFRHVSVFWWYLSFCQSSKPSLTSSGTDSSSVCISSWTILDLGGGLVFSTGRFTTSEGGETATAGVEGLLAAGVSGGGVGEDGLQGLGSSFFDCFLFALSWNKQQYSVIERMSEFPLLWWSRFVCIICAFYCRWDKNRNLVCCNDGMTGMLAKYWSTPRNLTCSVDGIIWTQSESYQHQHQQHSHSHSHSHNHSHNHNYLYNSKASTGTDKRSWQYLFSPTRRSSMTWGLKL